MENKITYEELHRLLHYDPETGIFRWKVSIGSRAKKGNIAGTKHHSGYIHIKIKRTHYAASELAWFYMEGYWPENTIDHENRIRHDNRWCNLRHISRQCNMRNRKVFKNSKSKVTGVYWYKWYGKWTAYIRVNTKPISLGYHIDFTDAVKARWNAEVKYGFPNCNSTSSAYLYLKEIGEI